MEYSNSDDSRDAVRALDNNYNVDPDWVGNSYREETSLNTIKYGNENYYHAKVGEGDNSHYWTCTWSHEVAVDKKDKDYTSKCCTEKGGTCSLANGIVIPAPNRNACTSANGSWVPNYSCKSDCTETKNDEHMCFHVDSTKENNYAGDYFSKTVDRTLPAGSNSTDVAYVHVPYNFELSGTISLKGDEVYAGETALLNTGSVTVEPRWNSKTNGNYATRAENVKAQVLTFVSDSPSATIPNGARPGKTCEIGSMAAYETKQISDCLGSSSVNVDDVPAGKYFCVAIQVSPSDSGSFDNLSVSNFNYSYRKSGVDCKPIAKRPTVQIWGGSNITTSRAEKNNLNGFADRSYKISGVSGANVFGSWDEQSTMVLGINTGFGSGAATANRLNKTGSAQQGRFESTTNGGFCKYESPLTFANFTKKMAIPICGANNNQSGKFGTTAVSVDKESYITSVVDTKPTSGFVGTTPFAIGSVINGTPTYSIVKSGTGKEILYTMGQNGKDVQLSASEIGRDKTYIIYSYKDVIIQGDITYENVTPEAGEEIKSDNIPKLIIYAKNSIRIDCGVKRVDAVLIGENEIDDCRGYGLDVNASQLSNQLVINGTIITDKAYMKRTYGAGTGKYSGIPAEIINYDSTLVIWARSRADTGETGVLNATYTHELAPRY